MSTLILLWSLLAVGGGGELAQARAESGRGALVLEVGFRAPQKKLLRVRDVARVVSDPEGAWPQVSAVILESKEATRVTHGRIVSRLRAAGLDSRKITLRGPAVCELDATLRELRETATEAPSGAQTSEQRIPSEIVSVVRKSDENKPVNALVEVRHVSPRTPRQEDDNND